MPLFDEDGNWIWEYVAPCDAFSKDIRSPHDCGTVVLEYLRHFKNETETWICKSGAIILLRILFPLLRRIF